MMKTKDHEVSKFEDYLKSLDDDDGDDDEDW